MNYFFWDASALGTPQQRMFLLVSEGKINEAVALAREHFPQLPGVMLQLADALVRAGAKVAAVALMTEQAKKKDAYQGYTRWLAEYHRQHGDPQAALEWQQKVFTQHPSVESFKVLLEVSSKIGQWEQVRAAALNALEREKKLGPLIEIALHEGDVARALELLARVSSGWGWRDYKWEVAQAAEKDYPQAAIALYKELAEQAIGARQRNTYQQAAEYVKRVKKLYERLNAQSEWDAYIRALRTQYARLPALQEELWSNERQGIVRNDLVFSIVGKQARIGAGARWLSEFLVKNQTEIRRRLLGH
ncbi:MAG: hypothetical protein HY314_06545 [Acidobacteria bacterium]|nr:hypothetical protein [Acidobacteriota bacterium]